MSFRQKAVILFVVVSLIGTLSISIADLLRGSGLNEQLTISSAKNAYAFIRDSVDSRLNTVSKYYDSLNAENVAMYLNKYRGIYDYQGVFIQLNKGQEVLYSTFTGPATSKPSSVMPTFFESHGTYYLAISSQLDLDIGQSFELTVFWDVQHLRTYQGAMLSFSAIVIALSILVIGVVGNYLMRHLTKPFGDLSNAARRFAEGQYEERVGISYKDEIGQFAQTFNLMADAIERQIHEMDDLVRDREQFIDHISHEIRTPITAMIGYSQVLMHTKATEADKLKAAEYIGQQSMRLKLLSEKLLSLSRLRYNTVELRPVKVGGILHAALKTLHGQLLSKNIQIVKDIPDVQVMGDEVLLETLFQNLIENAIHASPQDAKIELAGSVHGKSFVVSIQDNGIGVSEENLQRITEPFMCVDAARSRQHGGVGIGLALCKRICEIHHTTLVITSALGQGTRIEIDLTIP